MLELKGGGLVIPFVCGKGWWSVFKRQNWRLLISQWFAASGVVLLLIRRIRRRKGLLVGLFFYGISV
jgi:hypothetical protein